MLSAASDKGASCQPGCPGFAAKPRLIVDFATKPPREVPIYANLGPGPAKSYEMYGSSNAGDAWAIGGGREGSPRQVRIFRIAAGGWTAQRTFMRPPQRSHTKTFTSASVGLGYPAEPVGAIITGNTKEGVLVTRNANLWIASPSTVADNGNANISCDRSAWVFGDITSIKGVKCENVLPDGKK